MSGKHALVASYAIPEAERDTASRRLLDLIDFLCDTGYAITFVAASPITNPAAAKPLQARGVTVLDGMVTRRTEVGPEPILHEILAARPADLALLAYWYVAELYLPILRRVCPNARVLIRSVDLHCLRHARRLLGETSNGAKLLDAGFGAQLIGELNVYAAADGVLTSSEKEAAWIDNFCAGAARTFYVPGGDDSLPGARAFAEREGMLMLGNYVSIPNVDSVKFLCQEILPHVKEQVHREHPLRVVGNGLDELIQQATINTPNVQLIGWVHSVAPYFEDARVFVVPLRYGAGTKGRVVQALMSGTPTVTTTIGAEGLGLIHEQHALIADEPKEFAASIERLLADEILWRRLAENGRSLMLATHSRTADRKHFLAALEAIHTAPPRPALLPDISAKDYFDRVYYNYQDRLSARLRLLLAQAVPADATVIVLSDAQKGRLSLDGRNTWYFPQSEGGQPMLTTPSTSSEVLASLERLRQQGGNYLLVPFPQYWWLEHFAEFGKYLHDRCRLIASKDDVGKIFSLDAPACTLAKMKDSSAASLLKRIGSLSRRRGWSR